MPFFFAPFCKPPRWRPGTTKITEMEQHYWLHRCTCGDYAWPFSSELLAKHNLISIGWSDFSRSGYPEMLLNGRESFEKAFDTEWKYRPRNRNNLWRFLTMKTGDIVIVPMPRTFSVYRIADDIILNNTTINKHLLVNSDGESVTLDGNGYLVNSKGKQIDMGFYRKVEVVAKDIPRADYARQALFSRMKVQLSTVDITDLKEDVDFAVKCYFEHNPINLRRAFLEEAAKSLLSQMCELLNDQKLEKLVAWYMRRLGAETIIPAKNATNCEEGDADVIATYDRLNDFTVYIQVKAHQGYTDEWAVNQITTYRETMKNKGALPTHQLWVISTCKDFSKQAKLEAENSGVRLIAGLELAQMIIDEGAYLLPL